MFAFLLPNYLAIALESPVEYDQTWIFGGEHCRMAAFSREMPLSIFSRDAEVGSGRSSAAVKEAFAMAS